MGLTTGRKQERDLAAIILVSTIKIFVDTEKHQHMSHQVVNEIITLMGNTVLHKLLSNIREACWFTIIADETHDISNHDQLAIAIRWVGSTYDIHEYFIGLVHVPSSTSATLTVAIKDILIRCILPLNNCRGQAIRWCLEHDGSSPTCSNKNSRRTTISHNSSLFSPLS